VGEVCQESLREQECLEFIACFLCNRVSQLSDPSCLAPMRSKAAVWKTGTEAAVTCGARRLGAALRSKLNHQITFTAKNLLNTDSRAVI
jgi:hypothetical protein